jgi:polysaccharide biosynthesis/export protein
MLKRMLTAVAALLIAACATAPAPLPEANATTYLIGPGDELRVSVFRLAELTNTYRVSDSGVISIPLLDPITASGKSIDQVRDEIEAAVAEKNLVLNPSVSAEISQYRPFFVIGEVTRPGQFAYAPGMNVLTALGMAGGPTFRASSDKVVITRIVDGKAITGKVRLDSAVLPGDTIRVYEGWF